MVEQAPYSIKLYGSDQTLISDGASLVTLASLVSLTDLVSIELKTWGYYAKYENEGRIITAEENTKVEDVKKRMAWSFKIAQIDIKTEKSEMDSLEEVLRMRNKFITEVTSPYDVAICAADKAVAVVVEDDMTNTDGYFNYILNCFKRKINA